LPVKDELLPSSDACLRELNVPFVVSLMENCNEVVDSTIRTGFEMSSAIVRLRCVINLYQKVKSIFLC
jgi:hypothetical protein